MLPDGQKYEDWIQDKEGSGKDVKNKLATARMA
jgi:hypothetical protein